MLGPLYNPAPYSPPSAARKFQPIRSESAAEWARLGQWQSGRVARRGVEARRGVRCGGAGWAPPVPGAALPGGLASRLAPPVLAAPGFLCLGWVVGGDWCGEEAAKLPSIGTVPMAPSKPCALYAWEALDGQGKSHLVVLGVPPRLPAVEPGFSKEASTAFPYRTMIEETMWMS